MMFEKFTVESRRAIYIARHEALRRRSRSIRPAHILLGILCQQPALKTAWPATAPAVEELLSEVTNALPAIVDSTRDWQIPLSEEGKSVLRAADSSSRRFAHQHIGLEHLLAGLVAYEPRFWERLGLRYSLKRYLAQKGMVPATLEEHLRALQQPIATYETKLEGGND